MDDGKFGILETESGGKTISQQIAKDLKVGDQFKQLLEFTRRLRFNPENLSISPCPEQTLQQILKTAEVEYESSPINYREIILKLLHMIQGSPGLDPFDDYFVHDLSSKADPKDFQILINQTEKRLGIQAQQMQDEELAWKNRLQVEYDNASGFIIEAASEEGDIHSNFNKKPMDSILNKAWHHDADFLLYFDSEERRLWMRIQKGKRVDCRPLYRAFKKIVDKDEIFERGRSVGFDVGGLSIISGDIQAIVRSTNEELSHKREEDQEEVNDITNDLDSSFKDLE